MNDPLKRNGIKLSGEPFAIEQITHAPRILQGLAFDASSWSLAGWICLEQVSQAYQRLFGGHLGIQQQINHMIHQRHITDGSIDLRPSFWLAELVPVCQVHLGTLGEDTFERGQEQDPKEILLNG